jgi:hypothetical protein
MAQNLYLYKICNTMHRKGILVELGKSRNRPLRPQFIFSSIWITSFFFVFQIPCTFLTVPKSKDLNLILIIIYANTSNTQLICHLLLRLFHTLVAFPVLSVLNSLEKHKSRLREPTVLRCPTELSLAQDLLVHS